MFSKNKNDKTLSKEEKQKIRFYKSVGIFQGLIFSVYIILGIVAMSFFPIMINFETSLIERFFLFGYLTAAVYIVGFIGSFPFRMMIYRLYKKEDMLKQRFWPWATDWFILLGISLVWMVPFYTVAISLLYDLSKIGMDATFAGLFILMITFFFWRTGFNILSMVIIHGLYKLSSGEKYDYWSAIAKENKVKLYPVYILPIEEKGNWANALAFGSYSFGLILTSDQVMNKLTSPQFAAVMAHETAHLIKNHIPKRALICFVNLVLIASIFWGLTYLDSLLFFTVCTIVAVFGFLFGAAWIFQQQEYYADSFSRQILLDGHPMAEALEYLAEANKMPKEQPNKIIKRLAFHPSIPERRLNLGITEENTD